MLGKINRKCAAFLLAFVLLLSLQSPAFAKEISDGTYTVDYKVLKDATASVSIANDYFQKPAKLIVKDNQKYIQFVVSKSHWTKKLTMEGQNETVVGEKKKKDERTIQFAVKDLAKKQASTIDVFIDEKVDGEDFLYDNSYQIQFQFDEKTIKKISSTPEEIKVAPKEEKKQENKKVEKKSTNVAQLLTYGLCIIIFIALVVIIGRQMKGRK